MAQINIEIDKTFIEENAQEMGLLSATQVQTYTTEQQEQARTNIAAQLASANLDRLDGTADQQRAAIAAAGVNEPIVKNLRLRLQSANSGGTWGPRDGSIIAFFGNSAFLIGGWAGDPYDTDWVGGTVSNQIYRSNDFGVTWTLARGHDLTPASDQLPPVHTPAWSMHRVGSTDYCYVFGGDPFNSFSDTWRSSNGTTWEKVNTATAPYDGVYLAAGGSINGNLYHAGGHTTLLAGSARNTVYKSTNNGVSWTQIANAPWASRFCLDRMPAWKGKLWVVGGGKYDNDAINRVYYNDVWSFDPVTETWEEVLANGLAPWAARQYANVFVFEDWLYVSRGFDGITGNLSDTWRTTDGINWIPVQEIDLIASHADAIGIHSTGLLFATGNGWLSGTPTNTTSPSYFASIADQSAQESIVQVAHEVAQSYNQPLNGIITEGYTEGTDPKRLQPGDNNKIFQLKTKNYNEGQPDKSIIGAYATNGTTYVYIGGGLDASVECAQEVGVWLGADNTTTGELVEKTRATGKAIKGRLAIGQTDIPSLYSIDSVGVYHILGGDEGFTQTRYTLGTAQALALCSPTFSGSTVCNLFSYGWATNHTQLNWGGGLSGFKAATVHNFYAAATAGTNVGTIIASIDVSVSSTETGLLLLHGGSLKRVSVGASDSGGTGFRMLRIAN